MRYVYMWAACWFYLSKFEDCVNLSANRISFIFSLEILAFDGLWLIIIGIGSKKLVQPMLIDFAKANQEKFNFSFWASFMQKI